MTDPRALALRDVEVDLLFTDVGGTRVAVAAACVAEVLDPLPVAPLPGAPHHVEGVVQVRHMVAPLLDLRRRLEQPETAGASQILLLRSAMEGAAPLAIRVDRVVEIRHVHLGDIDAPPRLPGTRTTDRFLLGVLEGPVLLLDLEEILAADERVVLADLLASLPADAPPAEPA